ncbi:response regulator transcription factor [Alteriqipengyuania sp.]|uniref:response regulator transcription factor n=1 Tax=Alteriqipengyuania sp. TaxID=2800692 RepID=UPI003516ACF9
MREKLGLIEPDDALRSQVLRALDSAGFLADPFDDIREFVRFRGAESYAVLVGDERVDALHLRKSLCLEGEWLAVIAYSARPSLRRIVEFMRGGGYDYFALPLDTPSLARSLSQLDRGGTPYAAARRRASAARMRLKTLSPREAEVLAKMAEGQSNKAIGLDLGISPRTVEIHRANMLSKLAATCTTDALRMYYEDALLIGEAAIPDG